MTAGYHTHNLGKMRTWQNRHSVGTCLWHVGANTLIFMITCQRHVPTEFVFASSAPPSYECQMASTGSGDFQIPEFSGNAPLEVLEDWEILPPSLHTGKERTLYYKKLR